MTNAGLCQILKCIDFLIIFTKFLNIFSLRIACKRICFSFLLNLDIVCSILFTQLEQKHIMLFVHLFREVNIVLILMHETKSSSECSFQFDGQSILS